MRLTRRFQCDAAATGGEEKVERPKPKAGTDCLALPRDKTRRLKAKVIERWIASTPNGAREGACASWPGRERAASVRYCRSSAVGDELMMAMAAMATAAAIISFSFLLPSFLSLRPTRRCSSLPSFPPSLPSLLRSISRSTIERVEWHANEERERGGPVGRPGTGPARRGEGAGERIIV